MQPFLSSVVRWTVELGARRRAYVTKRNHNPRLKQVFKGAAQSALHRAEIRAYYQRLVERGTRPALARVSVARKLAAITLTLWKRKEKYDPKKIIAQN